MKRTYFYSLALMLFFLSCDNSKKEEDRRYTQSSDEIEVIKNLIRDYEDGNWDSFKKHYVDTAQIFHNSNDSSPLEDVLVSHREGTSGLSSYSFVDENDEYEMVITDEGNTWVNYWGLWEGTIAENNQQVSVPVHLTARFINGKIVEEHGYWDNVPMMRAMSEMQAAKDSMQTKQQE